MRLLVVLFLLTATSYTESLEFMVATTRQDAAMDWWYAVPEPFAPQIHQINRVAKGEYFRIIPIFKNYGVDTNIHTEITFDIKVVRPDGSIDESIDDCVGYKGEASPPNLIPSHTVLNLCFDPDDPYGDYSIQVTAYDHVASLTNRQTAVIEQKEFSMETLSAEERDQLFLTYATAPNPSRALAAFLQTEHSFFNEENEPIWSAIWFFKTIFEENDYLIPHLLKAFPKGSPKQQQDIVLVLSLMNQTDQLPRVSGELSRFKRLMESGRVPNPYDEITTGKQLDMLWAEYFATGRVKPIKQLVTSLNLSEHLGTLDQIEAGELDPEMLEVYRAGMLEAVFQSALWSLRSNCTQSPLVFHYCVGILHSEELEKPVHSCLAMLLKSITKPQKGKTP